MNDSRERRPRGRKKVHYDEVLPSTDLPPLVQGDLRCFLIVDIGKIQWSSTATAQVPPASPAFVRLRWWGETSDGTLFKPASLKNGKVIKSRCRFGVRSGAKQMSAYFMDMGSIVLDVLTSPRSVPLGRIQIPKVAQLSSESPIRDYFKIISPSSRKVGEIHISIHFRPLEDAYSITTDTGTDTSMSSRSRPPSEVGRRSRSRGSSVGSRSNAGSARSRSSSGGSRKGKKKRSTSRSKGRGRSRSSESNASSASRRSQLPRKASTIDSSAPRGIDDLLKQNGHDFYGIENKPPKSSTKQTRPVVDHDDATQAVPGQDVISALLRKGNRLREDVLKSRVDSAPNTARDRLERMPDLYVGPSEPANHFEPEVHTRKPAATEATRQFVPSHLQQVQNIPKTITPIKERRQDLDMRFVDLVFGSEEFKGHPSFLTGMESPLGSPLSSMISEFEDNPLHDESLLQQMFYNNGVSPSAYSLQRVNDRMKVLERARREERPEEDLNRKKTRFEIGQPTIDRDHLDSRTRDVLGQISGVHVLKVQALRKIHLVRITIETLRLLHADDATPSKRRQKKGAGRGSKPPVPSPSRKQKLGTYLVEFKLPVANTVQREHPSSMTTSHEVTRVASRKLLDTEARTVVFEEVCEFPVRFTNEEISKWNQEGVEFVIYGRKSADKKASPIGVATLPLRKILQSEEMTFGFDLEVMDHYRPSGMLKVSVELIPDPTVSDSDDPEIEIEKEPHAVDEETEKIELDTPKAHEHGEALERQGSSIALSPSTSVLYMMLMVQEGSDIPGTTVISPSHGTSSHPPNVFLVCRTLTSGENQKTSVIWGESDPKFDFLQISPLKLDNALLSRMQNNFIVIEVWTKMTTNQPHSDKLLGLVKIPTHHFYQSLRDEEISRVILKSQHPLISTDEQTPIVDLFTGQERGKLQVTLALGTQSQIATLRKIKSDIQERRVKQHHLEEKQSENKPIPEGLVEHSFEISVVKLDGFKPQDNQVWGETDCFIQYQFPEQKSFDDSVVEDSKDQDDENMQNMNFASMQNYRTDATLCVPNPVFNDARRHTFRPPPSLPVQRILLSCCYTDGVNGGIPFELWSRYYHPNVRDQLLAKGLLPITKLGALVTMTTSRVSEQTFQVPLEYADLEPTQDESAGRLEVHVKYRASGTTLESTQPTMQFTKPVILRVGLLRGCGLKAAARLACRHSEDDDLKRHADVGLNTYVRIKPTFLPDEESRTSRLVAQSFAPEYQHHMEVACPLVSYHSDVTPVSLAELLVSGEIEFSVWHRHSGDDNLPHHDEDILLGTLTLPTRSLLRKTTGLHSWFTLEPTERNRRHGDGNNDVGALEISVSFSHSSDLDLIFRAAKAAGWSLPHFESRMLSNDAMGNNDIMKPEEHMTFSVTVTNAWLPKHELLLHNRTSIDTGASAFLRYKFFDHDSVTSSLCPLVAKHPHSVETRFENLVSARIAHKKSFVCKRSRPLTWYIQEEKLELQIWLTHSKTDKKSRPMDSDKLLGISCIDLSSITDFTKEQHISGSFKLFRMGSDDLGGGKVRVYVSMKPGAVADPIPDPLPVSVPVPNSDEEASSQKASTAFLEAQKLECISFPAVVTVERAMHLPPVGDLETGGQAEPNCYASFEAVDSSVAVSDVEELKMVTMTTKIATATSSPIWGEISEVHLPRQLLSGAHGALLLKVWHRDCMYINQPDPAESPAGHSKPGSATAPGKTELMATDRMLGFATVDLSVLRAGFRDVNGWYNILDIHGQCQGQLKVAVTPSKVPELSQPVSARTQDTNTDGMHDFLLSGVKGVTFLNQAPLNIPVQTPSGSMYYPGLPSSAQSVKATCRMSETEESDFRQRTHGQQALPPMGEVPHSQHGPSVSMFRYASSDRQQACLVNTLQKQMQELEEIKKRFEHRRAAGFENNRHESALQQTQSDSTNTHENEMQKSPIEDLTENLTEGTAQKIQHENKHQKRMRKIPDTGTEHVHECTTPKIQHGNKHENRMRKIPDICSEDMHESSGRKIPSRKPKPHHSDPQRYLPEKHQGSEDSESSGARSLLNSPASSNVQHKQSNGKTDYADEGGVSFSDLYPNRRASFDAIPDLKITQGNASSHDDDFPSPSAGPDAKASLSSQSASECKESSSVANGGKTVHLSLYERRKNQEFGDRPLSDNEVSSDVEFVQPRSLNENPGADFQDQSPVSASLHPAGSTFGSDDFDVNPEEPPLRPVPSALTPARSEGHSALENTSLWLSGSTLQVSSLSDDGEDQTPNVKPTSNGENETIPLKIDEFEDNFGGNVKESQNSREEIGEGEIGQNQCEEGESQETHFDQEELAGEADLMGDGNRREAEEMKPDENQQQSLALSEAEDSEEDQESHDQGERSEVQNRSHPGSEVNGQEDGNTDMGRKADDTQDIHFEPRPSAIETAEQPSLQQSPTTHQRDVQARLRENDENACPNRLKMVTTGSSRGQLFPNFFPPTRDLEASMRALQEATTKHKHDLLKKKKCEGKNELPLKENVAIKRSPPKTRKVPPKPEDFSDERTKRLARIFRTKFS